MRGEDFGREGRGQEGWKAGLQGPDCWVQLLVAGDVGNARGLLFPSLRVRSSGGFVGGVELWS